MRALVGRSKSKKTKRHAVRVHFPKRVSLAGARRGFSLASPRCFDTAPVNGAKYALTMAKEKFVALRVARASEFHWGLGLYIYIYIYILLVECGKMHANQCGGRYGSTLGRCCSLRVSDADLPVQRAKAR